MSRHDVRAAVVTWLDGHVDGLTQVKRAKPMNVEPAAYFKDSGDQTGAIAYAYIEGEHEVRLTPPLGLGWKQINYVVGVRVDFRSLLMSDTEGSIDAYDATIDAIKERLREDPQLGTGGTIFLAGEGDTKVAPDIELVADLPKESGDAITIWSVLRFIVVQMIQA